MCDNNLKFRVWDLEKKNFIKQEIKKIGGIEYQFGDLYLDLEGNLRYLNYDSLDIKENVVIQRYTGAEDCDGIEIYEGDILKVKRCHIESYETSPNVFKTDVIEDGEEVGCVIWCDTSYRFLISFDHLRHDDYIDFYGISHRYKIIGNIYENASLIEN